MSPTNELPLETSPAISGSSSSAKVGPENRRERAAQAEVLEDDHLAARDGAAGRHVDRHAEAAGVPRARYSSGAAASSARRRGSGNAVSNVSPIQLLNH